MQFAILLLKHAIVTPSPLRVAAGAIEANRRRAVVLIHNLRRALKPAFRAYGIAVSILWSFPVGINQDDMGRRRDRECSRGL